MFQKQFNRIRLIALTYRMEMEEPCRFGLVEFRSTTEKSWSNRYSLSGSDFFFVSLLNSWNEALTGLTQPSLSEFYLSWMDSLEIWPTISWCRRGAEFFFLLFKVSEEREKTWQNHIPRRSIKIASGFPVLEGFEFPPFLCHCDYDSDFDRPMIGLCSS